jgi:purine-binding chemotaxis protein CheW
MIEMPQEQNHEVDEEVELIGDRYTQFKLHKELYAVPVSMVNEILMERHVTEVPGTPPFLQGVINLRGEIIPLFDMKMLFKFPPKDAGEGTFLVVLNVDEITLAIQVDGVKEVVHISQEKRIKGGRAVSTMHPDFVTDVARTEPLTTLLDMGKIVQHIEEMLA